MKFAVVTLLVASALTACGGDVPVTAAPSTSTPAPPVATRVHTPVPGSPGATAVPGDPGPLLVADGVLDSRVVDTSGATVTTIPSGNDSVSVAGPYIVATSPDGGTMRLFDRTAQVVATMAIHGHASVAVASDGSHWLWTQGDVDTVGKQPQSDTVFSQALGGPPVRLMARAVAYPSVLTLLGWSGNDVLATEIATPGKGSPAFRSEWSQGLLAINAGSGVTRTLRPATCQVSSVNAHGVALTLCPQRTRVDIYADTATGQTGTIVIAPPNGEYGGGGVSPDGTNFVLGSARRTDARATTLLRAKFAVGAAAYFGPDGSVPVTFLPDSRYLATSDGAHFFAVDIRENVSAMFPLAPGERGAGLLT